MKKLMIASILMLSFLGTQVTSASDMTKATSTGTGLMFETGEGTQIDDVMSQYHPPVYTFQLYSSNPEVQEELDACKGESLCIEGVKQKYPDQVQGRMGTME